MAASAQTIAKMSPLDMVERLPEEQKVGRMARGAWRCRSATGPARPLGFGVAAGTRWPQPAIVPVRDADRHSGAIPDHQWRLGDRQQRWYLRAPPHQRRRAG